VLGLKYQSLKAFQASGGLLGSSVAWKLLLIYLGEREIFMQRQVFLKNCE